MKYYSEKMENPGDYYLNEGDADYDFGDSSKEI